MPIQDLLCSALKYSNSNSFTPEEHMTWLALEKPRGTDLSFQKKVEEAWRLAGSNGEVGKAGLDILSGNDFLSIFYELRAVAKNVAGDFRLLCPEENDEIKDQFYDIWELFIEKWYFQSVYVGHGWDLVELDRKIIKKNQDPRKDVYENCPFRLYTFNGEKFYSIIAGNLVESSILTKERLVKCCFDENFMFIMWWNLLQEYFSGLDRCLNAFKAASKQIVMHNFSNDDKSRTIDEVLNSNTVFFKPTPKEDLAEETFVEQVKFFDTMDVQNLFGIVYDYIERKAARLGYVFKPAQMKKDRTNSGENYALNKQVFNMQTIFLTKLNSCFWRMRKKFGESVIPKKMKVVLSNQAFALGLPVGQDPQQQGYLRNGHVEPNNENNKLNGE